MFDENLKRGMKRQLDMHMRFWNDCKVNLQCLASFSAGHHDATQMYEKIESVVI